MPQGVDDRQTETQVAIAPVRDALPEALRSPPAALTAASLNWLYTLVWAAPVRLAVAYYLGARLGFLLQSPLVPQSVLWLPNAILLTALIISSPRRWPALLVAAYPAQMMVAWQTHAPPVTMSLIFLTNCADAALGAAIWKFVSPKERRVEGLRRMLVFLPLVAILPTLTLSFADAGVTIARQWSTNYWLVFVTRARADVLTNVIFVPAAIDLLSTSRDSLLAGLRARWKEAAIMLLALVGSGAAAYQWCSTCGDSGTAAYSYLPLIFVVWSAVRFGIAMTGGTLLTLAFMMTWMTLRGATGLNTIDVADHLIPTLQLELLAIAVPVLCLCAVSQDRERATRALASSQDALNESLAQIRSLAGRLLTATEVERTRIARDLHDDINQQLAAIGIGLSALKRHVSNDDALRGEVAALQSQAMRAADSVRWLSHDLHPAALQHAGLVPALRALCAQYGHGDAMRAVLAVRSEVNVEPEVALCVYRVSQEALRNAARHAAARAAHLSLRANGNLLEMQIEDDGKGFDQAAALRRGGLGLTSMAERVRLVGGTVHVDTAVGRGTRIFLRVPCRETNGSADAAARG